MRIELQLGIVLVLAGAACSDPASDSLLGSRSTSNGANGGGATATTVNGSGTSSGTGTSSGAGSTGTGTGGGAGGSSGGAAGPGSPGSPGVDGGIVSADGGGSGPRALFEALLPSLETSCGGPCHVQGLANAPAYLGGPDPYATIKTYAGMIASDPTQSALLTKGVHEGPALPAALKASVTQWLTAEAAVAIATGPVTTAPATITSGANKVDLSKLGVAGASLSFSAAISADILTLTALTITAPATTGIHVTFPAFYASTATGATSENDDLSNVDQTIAAGASAPLGTGLLLLTGWAPTDTLQVAFSKIAPAAVVDAGATGGCKSVASFITNAVTAIQNNTCMNCHNTGGSGNASLDLSGLAANPLNDAVACAQALGRINTTTPAQSDIILAPTGKVANHPYKAASAAYTTMMTTWITAEK